MKLTIYSIYDTASATYMRPFFLASDGQATRMFKDIACDAEHEVGRHPEDYSLIRIGIFDDQNSKITPEDPECIATALEMVGLDRKNVNKQQLNLANISAGGTD